MCRNYQPSVVLLIALVELDVWAVVVRAAAGTEAVDDCFALAGDCHAIYMSIDDSLRRIADQAFFDKLIVTDDDTIHSEPGVPFNVFLARDVQTLAVHQHGQTRNLELKPVMSLV